MIFRGVGSAFNATTTLTIPSGIFAFVAIAGNAIYVNCVQDANTLIITNADDGEILFSIVTVQQIVCMHPISTGKTNKITVACSGTGALVQIFEAVP